MRTGFRFVALGALYCYLALFPGSTTTVALNAVPDWGAGMGAVLLMLQGIAAVAWLIGSYGRRGLAAGVLMFVLAWGVEHVGETTGVLFGRYQYTDVLQPQILAVVPVPITCAWLIVALGSWQLAGWIWPIQVIHRPMSEAFGRIVLSATLIVALDLQIETIATLVNQYWIWADSGAYYGVPAINFVMWWLVGVVMGIVLSLVLPGGSVLGTRNPQKLHIWVFSYIPALMYLLSSLMFTIINLAYGYLWAGGVGVVLLGGVLIQAVRSVSAFGWPIALADVRVGHQTSD